MLKIYFNFILIFVFANSVFSQEITLWQDFITYSDECPGTIPEQIIPLPNGDFEYTVSFGSNVAGPHTIGGQIERKVIFEFTDFDGNLLKIVPAQSVMLGEYKEYSLDGSDLEDLPIDVGAIYVSIKICYVFVNDEEGNIHDLNVFANGALLCEGSFTTIGDEFCSEINNVLCFYLEECDGFYAEIDAVNTYTMKAKIQGSSSNYSYQWTFEDLETGEISDVGSAQSITVDPCAEGTYCVVVTENETGCIETDCLLVYPSADCNLCYIATPGGLSSAHEPPITILSWDETLGAVSYSTRIIFNDPECCPVSEAIPVVKVIGSEEPIIILNTNESQQCFSWKVTAICDGNGQSTSEKKCEMIPSFRKKSINTSKRNNDHQEISIYPNPTQSNAIITIENIEDEIVRLEIFSFDGKKIISELIPVDSQNRKIKRELGSQLEQGIYIVKVSSERMSVSKKLIIQR